MIAIWSLNFVKITFWTMQLLEHFNLVIGVRNRLEFHQFIAAGSLFKSIKARVVRRRVLRLYDYRGIVRQLRIDPFHFLFLA